MKNMRRTKGPNMICIKCGEIPAIEARIHESQGHEVNRTPQSYFEEIEKDAIRRGELGLPF